MVAELNKVDIQNMIEVGAHFGHQTQRWNPKMSKFIFGARNGVHIINLDLTQKLWTQARKFVVDQVSGGAKVLFVGTKHQARAIIKENAERCGAYSITTRWLGGTLSNFQTIKNSINRMKKLEEFLNKAAMPDTKIKIAKKEKLAISKELEKLAANLGGIRDMREVPDIIFVVDINKEAIAVSEAKNLGLPVVALVDTNVDPDSIDFPIPSNDDAVRAIKLFVAAMADAVIEGNAIFQSRRPEGGQRGGNRRSRNENRNENNDKAEKIDSGTTTAATPA